MEIKLIFLTIFVISFAWNLEQSSTQDIKIECTFSSISYTYFGLLPTCTLKSTTSITKENTNITGIGTDYTAKNPNTQVKVFYAASKVIRYFPLGLDVLLPKLLGIRLESTQLRVISKEDLKPFPNILMFASVGNEIQFLEKDLFVNNKNLTYVSFSNNKITFIEPTVFNDIQKNLVYLYMNGQALSCGLGDSTSATAVTSALIKLATSVCADISNAPPLYVLWQNCKARLEKCEGKSITTTTTIPTTTTPTTTTPTTTTPTTTTITTTPTTTTASSDLAKCQDDLNKCNICRSDPTVGC